jgi:hypothetical protein
MDSSSLIQKWMEDDNDTSFDAIYVPYFTSRPDGKCSFGKPVKHFFRNGKLYSKFMGDGFNPELKNFTDLHNIIFGVYANKMNLEKSSPLLMVNGECAFCLSDRDWLYATYTTDPELDDKQVKVLRNTRLILLTLEEYYAIASQKRAQKGWVQLGEQAILPTAPIYEELL